MNDLIERAAKDLLSSVHAIALTGAGMSTESGIPDFRGPKGIWTTDKEAEAKAYQRYELFLTNPKSYWENMMGRAGTHGAFYNEVRKAEPNAGHRALAELGEMGLVKCVVTQNIDGLHLKAGSEYVIEYHGSIHKLRCPTCGCRYEFEHVPLHYLPPYCKCGGVLKLDVVHFKEPIPVDAMKKAEGEALKCDLMLICGTSAVVYPFAGLPRIAKQSNKSRVTIIELNAEPTPLTYEGLSDYLIRGNTGEILPRMVKTVRGMRKSG